MEEEQVDRSAADDDEGVLRAVGGQSVFGSERQGRLESQEDDHGPERRGIPERVFVRGAYAGDFRRLGRVATNRVYRRNGGDMKGVESEIGLGRIGTGYTGLHA